MTYSWGSRASGVEQTLGADATLKVGRVYRVKYSISGFSTLLPGWEERGAAQIRQNLYSKGCTMTYISINPYLQMADVEFTYNEGATPYIAPLVAILVVVVCVAVVAGLYFAAQMAGSAKEIFVGGSGVPGAASDIKDTVKYAAIAVVAIVGAFALYKLLPVVQSFVSGGAEDYATD